MRKLENSKVWRTLTNEQKETAKSLLKVMWPKLVGNLYSQDPIKIINSFKCLNRLMEVPDLSKMNTYEKQGLFVAIFDQCRLGIESSDKGVNHEAIILFTKMSSKFYENFDHINDPLKLKKYLNNLKTIIQTLNSKIK